MTIGFGLFLIAVGAILRFAVTATVAGVDIQTVGVILMVVGAIAFVISLVFEFNRRSGRQPPPPPPPPPSGY
jgi:Flp pilus assembly protein protease CpaA